jgi:hypothetical protein
MGRPSGWPRPRHPRVLAKKNVATERPRRRSLPRARARRLSLQARLRRDAASGAAPSEAATDGWGEGRAVEGLVGARGGVFSVSGRRRGIVRRRGLTFVYGAGSLSWSA